MFVSISQITTATILIASAKVITSCDGKEGKKRFLPTISQSEIVGRMMLIHLHLQGYALKVGNGRKKILYRISISR